MTNEIKLLFVGDIYIKDKPNSKIIDKDLEDIFTKHDIISCNFEGPISTKSLSPIKKVGPSIIQYIDAPKLLKDAGFNVINIGNNHILDYGRSALEETIKSFNSQIVVGAGVDVESAYKLKVKYSKGIKIGFLSFSEAGFGALYNDSINECGYAWVNNSIVDELVYESKNKVDFLVVQIHAGVEEVELPIPEWRQRYKRIIDQGADLIIGHHPHIPQGWEIYKDKIIFYSLGNFYFDLENPPLYWDESYMVSLTINSGKMTAFKVISVEKGNYSIRLNNKKSFRDKLKYLCSLLEEPHYTDLANKQAVSLWFSRYKNYYLSSFYIEESNSFSKNIKILIKYLLKRNIKIEKNIDSLFLLHNIIIESHLWTVQRALINLEKVEYV